MPTRYDYQKAAPTSPMDTMGRMTANAAPSQTPARAVGRSPNDPNRIAEQQRRRGNWRPIMQLGAQAQAQQFTLGRDEAARKHEGSMFEMQQKSQHARDAEARQQRFDEWNRSEAARRDEEERRRTHEVGMWGLHQGAAAMEAERKRNQEEQDRQRTPNVGTVQVPGTDYVIPTADGRAMGTLPVARPPGPLPEGFVPKQVKRDGTTYVDPKQAPPAKPQISWQDDGSGTRVPYQTIIGEDGTVTLRKVKIVDANNDGIDDREQAGGGAGASGASGAPAPKSSGFLNF